MSVTSNAVARGRQRDPADDSEYEVRVFERPDGDFSWAFYADDETPDAQPFDGPHIIEAANAELMIAMLTR